LGRRLLAISLMAALGSASQAAEGSAHGMVRLFTLNEAGQRVPKPDASSVVVYLIGFNQSPPADVPRISQKNKTFIPDILPIVVGQTVEFTNDDNIIHNVFSTSKARTFDLGKPRAGESRRVKFDQTGLVDVYCDIHEQMVATILVLPNRAFSITGRDGSFTLKGLPPGHYSLFAWNRAADPARVEVDIRSGENTEADLELTETKLNLTHLGKYGQPYRKQPDYPP
jgi:plastocyanin